MPLYDAPPMTVTLYTGFSETDAGGGVFMNYTLTQSDIPCSLNLVSAAEREMFASQGIDANYTVGFLGSVATITRGSKLIVTSASPETGLQLRVEAIRAGAGYGTIPALTYAVCSRIF